MFLNEASTYPIHYVFDGEKCIKCELDDYGIWHFHQYCQETKTWPKIQINPINGIGSMYVEHGPVISHTFLKSKSNLVNAFLKGHLNLPYEGEYLKAVSLDGNMKYHEWVKSPEQMQEAVLNLQNSIFKFEKMENYSFEMGELIERIRRRIKGIVRTVDIKGLPSATYNTFDTNHYFLGGKDSVSFGFHTDPYITTMVPAYSEEEVLKTTQIKFGDEVLEIPMTLGTIITVMPGVEHNNIYHCESAMHSISFEKYFDTAFGPTCR